MTVSSRTIDAHCASKNAYDLVVTDILVADGEHVTGEQLLMTLEYYKVVSEIIAPANGVVNHIRVALKDEVQVGEPLIDFTPA